MRIGRVFLRSEVEGTTEILMIQSFISLVRSFRRHETSRPLLNVWHPEHDICDV